MGARVRAPVFMSLPYHPHPGDVLICDFDATAIGAEMIKRRPVVVVSRRDASGTRLATVVPLSTTAPQLAKAWHHAMPQLRIKGWPDTPTTWAKCDMLATVSFERLNKPYVKTRSGRSYISLALDKSDLDAVRAGVRSWLGL
jgi:mRNA interferase MazF